MKRNFYLMIYFLVAAGVSIAIAEIRETDIIKKKYTLTESSEATKVIVDNVVGSIKVAGEKGNNVELIIHKQLTASSEATARKAREEISLDIRHDGNRLRIFVDGPFRCNSGSVSYRGWRDYGYKMQYDFELKVPTECDLELKTINDGDIHVSKIKGDFEVKNVNGEIEMKNIDGSGYVHTINGEVYVMFDENPQRDSHFGSLNGDVDVYFNDPLSAVFLLKTFNGEVFSDFEVEYVPSAAIKKIEKGRKNIYKRERKFSVAAGTGGPEIELDTFNGDIHILSK